MGAFPAPLEGAGSLTASRNSRVILRRGGRQFLVFPQFCPESGLVACAVRRIHLDIPSRESQNYDSSLALQSVARHFLSTGCYIQRADGTYAFFQAVIYGSKTMPNENYTNFATDSGMYLRGREEESSSGYGLDSGWRHANISEGKRSRPPAQSLRVGPETLSNGGGIMPGNVASKPAAPAESVAVDEHARAIASVLKDMGIPFEAALKAAEDPDLMAQADAEIRAAYGIAPAER